MGETPYRRSRPGKKQGLSILEVLETLTFARLGRDAINFA